MNHKDLTVKRLLDTASDEVGYLEKKSAANLDDKTANAGNKNYTKYASDLDAIKGFYNGRKQGSSWCDVFVDWCFVQAFGVEVALKLLCQVMGGCGAGVKYSAQYFKAKGQFIFKDPSPGDQIFFVRRDKAGNIAAWLHTGIVEKVAGGYVYTIEGNTGGTSGVVSNGGGVCRKRYTLNSSSIGGYGRPDWSLVPQEITAPPRQDKMEDDDMMDVTKFEELFNEMRHELQDNDSGKWSEEARRWAISSGLVAGNGTQISGEPNYMWEDILTREQLVTVLYRFAKLIGQA